MSPGSDRVRVLAFRFTTSELCQMQVGAALAGHLLFAESCRWAIAEKIVKEEGG